MKFYSGRPLSIQSPSDEPFALGFRYFELLDRKLDRRLRIGLMVDDANDLGPASRGAVNAPGVAFNLLGRALVHSVTIAEKTPPAPPTGLMHAFLT
jgi:hypothetical protein